MGDVVKLAAGNLRLDLRPDLGGGIARFQYGDGPDAIDLMRPAAEAPVAAGELSCYPLVPVSNRIVDGKLKFRGETIEMALNFGDHPHHIHGHGWQGAWSVAAQGPASATLVFGYARRGATYAYRASQTFTLDGVRLTVDMAVMNFADGAMPFGLGLHPYFDLTPEATLTARAEAVWLNDERMAPLSREPVPEGWDFSAGRAVADTGLDNCFAGWDGRARIAWPERNAALAIEADPAFGHLIVYTPAHGNYFCVEPVTNANDGFNQMESGRDDTGTVVLEPSESFSGRVTFTAEVG